MFSNENNPKLSLKFVCKNCDYGTSKKSNYDNHIRSAKHTKSIFSNENKPQLSHNYACILCSKEYKDNSGLWRHKKKCIASYNQEINDEINEDSKYTPSISDLHSQDKQHQLIESLLKENAEFKQMMV